MLLSEPVHPLVNGSYEIRCESQEDNSFSEIIFGMAYVLRIGKEKWLLTAMKHCGRYFEYVDS